MRLILKLFCILALLIVGCASDSSTHGTQEWMIYWGESTSPNSRPHVFAHGDGLVIDDRDNEYVIGEFINKVDFDPGSGLTEVEAVSNDIFLSKFDPDGNFQWVRTWGLSDPNTRPQIDDNRFPEVALDHAGNFLITGRFIGTWDFDPGQDIQNRSSTDWSSVYLLKFDHDGNFLDLKTWDDTGSSFGFRPYVDQKGSIYLAGDFKGTLDLDPGPGELVIESSSEDPGLFLAKYSPDLIPVWAKTWEGLHLWDFKIDAERNLILSCDFRKQIDADPGPDALIFTPAGHGSELVMKLDDEGSLMWAKTWSYPQGMTALFNLDSAGSVYVAGFFSGSVDFDPGPGEKIKTVPPKAQYDYLTKLSPEGAFQWVRVWGSPRNDLSVSSILISNAGIVFVAGVFSDRVDFDPSYRVDSIKSNGGYDAFLAAYSLDGEFLWARAIGTDSNWEPIRGMASDSNGRIIVAGEKSFGDAFLGKFSP